VIKLGWSCSKASRTADEDCWQWCVLTRGAGPAAWRDGQHCPFHSTCTRSNSVHRTESRQHRDKSWTAWTATRSTWVWWQ